MEPLIYNPLVKSTGDNLDLWLEPEVGGWEQSCNREPLARGSWCYPQVRSVRIQLNCRTPDWWLRIAWWCEGESSTHIRSGCGTVIPYSILAHPYQTQASHKHHIWLLEWHDWKYKGQGRITKILKCICLLNAFELWWAGYMEWSGSGCTKVNEHINEWVTNRFRTALWQSKSRSLLHKSLHLFGTQCQGAI